MPMAMVSRSCSLDATDNKPNIILSQWQAQTKANGRQDQKSRFVFPLDLPDLPDPSKKPVTRIKATRRSR